MDRFRFRFRQSPKHNISSMATRTSTYLLLFIAACAQGFNVGRQHQLGRLVSSRGNSLPPLFFTDIEPEIRSNTINFINCDSMVVQSSNDSGSDYFCDKPRTHRQKTDRGTTEKSKAYKSHRSIWQTRYNELKLYRAQNGHCMLPQSYIPNPKLGWWVMQQRRQYTLQQRGKKSSFDGPDGKKRIQLLNDIGFVWRVERRGTRGSTIGNRNRLQYSSEGTIVRNGGVLDKVYEVNDFEKYMIEMRKTYSDEEMRAAWRRRYEYFR
ncbi:hypothetical protein ACHAWU_005959 [Discostella pseudostelligera]|uniref:Helicase-associated domain-containing protein n=1 Tax=Discostella pseudostelligera TaxID=259834 RepID=A0ABD3MCR4_9STRA